MKRMKSAFSVALLILAAAVVASAQGQVTAVRAGKMFDPKSGTNLANQVILITGDKTCLVAVKEEKVSEREEPRDTERSFVTVSKESPSPPSVVLLVVAVSNVFLASSTKKCVAC